MTAVAKSRSVPVNPYRRAMIAKINLAKSQLGMEEEDYRAGLLAATGKTSLTQCNEAALAQVLDWLKSKGFRPVQSKGAAVHPMARKARALWISLYHLGEVRNPSDEALEAFAARQLKCDRLVWANQRQAYQLIEALKAWAVRAGWPEAGGNSATASPIALQATLCGAILRKLKERGIAKPDWDLIGAAMQLTGRMPTKSGAGSIADYRLLAEQLGKVLRDRAPTKEEGAA